MIVHQNEIPERRGSVLLSLDFAEVLAISNALNEVLEFVPEWEFHARTGVEKVDAERLHEQVRRLLRQSSTDGSETRGT